MPAIPVISITDLDGNIIKEHYEERELTPQEREAIVQFATILIKESIAQSNPA